MNYYTRPVLSRGALHVARRNFMVWRKLLAVGLLMHILEPLFYLVALGYGLGSFIREISGMSYLSFLASGILVSSTMMTASFESMFATFSRLDQQRTHEGLMAAPLTVDDIATGEILWAASKSVISGAGILLVALLLGAIEGWRSLLALPVIFLTGLVFSAMALNITALARRWDFFHFYMTLFLTPMVLLCGVFYPISSLPDWLVPLVNGLPLSHAIAVVRPLVTGQPVTDLAMHLGVLFLVLMVFWFSAVVLMRRRLYV